MTKKINALLVIIASISVAQPLLAQPDNAHAIPAQLMEGRFFIKIPTLQGDTLLGYCDTGGGYTAIYASTVAALGLYSKLQQVVINGDTTRYITASDIYRNNIIPYPQIAPYYKPYISEPFLEAPADNRETIFLSKLVNYQVFLGQFFFVGNAWTFDYPAGKLYVNTPLANDADDPNMQAIGFKKDKAGNKRFGHASTKLEIDGKTIDFLFDTGAMLLLNDSSRKALGINAKTAAGSFIAESVFNEWRSKHREWKVIEKGEITGADLIEVPEVKIGTLSAGPVWFAKRPDAAWSKGMIGSMDKVVKGAIGGSFLQYFKVTIDYNSELIRFEK